MEFSVETHGAVTVIALEGNLMGGPDATSLNSKLHELLGAGKNQIVLDLTKVQFMNSSGLGLLLGGVNAVKSGGGTFKIAGASEKIRALIKITKLEKVLESYPTVKDALARSRT
jgi:anti-sigma B factor antagonist